jgi:hypothetical protein
MCKHEFRLREIDKDLLHDKDNVEYYYCIHCLLEAMITENAGKRTALCFTLDEGRIE